MVNCKLRILETPEEMTAVENLTRLVWPDSEIDIVPAHLLIAMARNGGLIIGAYPNGEEDDWSITEEQEPVEGPLIGYVFGFPGLYHTPDGPRTKHYSHQLAVHPDYRNQGIGFALKRAQWQMVRHQGIDRINWTFDPLLSANAHLNIARLGAVCNTYLLNMYGPMRDGLNAGLASDRLMVDWWVNSKRVERRLSSKPRLKLDLAHFLAGGAQILNPSHLNEEGLPEPGTADFGEGGQDAPASLPELDENLVEDNPILLLEIPDDFQSLKAKDLELAQKWRQQTRHLFEALFTQGYLITDFIFLHSATPRSFYVLSHGERTL